MRNDEISPADTKLLLGSKTEGAALQGHDLPYLGNNASAILRVHSTPHSEMSMSSQKFFFGRYR
jgi:hypothetical protein